MTQVFHVALLCLLVSSPVNGQENQECSKDFEKTLVGQGLDYDASLKNGASVEGPLKNVSNPAACLAACCNKEACHLAIVGYPQDGLAQCYLVNCMQDGKDVCQMRKMTAFTAYKKRQLQASPRVENRSAAESADRCAAPMVVGSCRAAFPRFYYDAANQSCRQFIYGGCGGNANNFETLAACKAACNGSRVAEMSNEVPSGPVARRMTSTDLDAAPPKASLPEMTPDEYAEVCQAKPMTGPCRASILRFFYNSSTGACQSFIYGGCRGNRNNHASADECLATCTVTVVPSGKKAPSDEKSCAGKGDPGPCRAAFSKFYFDSDTTSCQPFIYGGCQGNGNRYDSVADCMFHCTGTEGNLDEHGQHPNRWTPAFFMVTTLVLMAAVLLVGLVLISVRKMKGRQRRSRDDKQELLPEDQLATEQNA